MRHQGIEKLDITQYRLLASNSVETKKLCLCWLAKPSIKVGDKNDVAIRATAFEVDEYGYEKKILR